MPPQLDVEQDAVRVFGRGLRFPEGPVLDGDGEVPWRWPGIRLNFQP